MNHEDHKDHKEIFVDLARFVVAGALVCGGVFVAPRFFVSVVPFVVP
jgi:hypothetical protein